MIKRLIKLFSERARRKRGYVFCKFIQPCENDKILDLGSEDGHYISSIIPYRKNVYIANISCEFLEEGREKYGFKSILLPEEGCIPVEDKSFDIVHCSSVIEHATVKKDSVYNYKTWKEFRAVAFEKQKQFSNEIRRIAKNYFVQTPNKYFIIESHTWLPLTNFLPRWILIPLSLC